MNFRLGFGEARENFAGALGGAGRELRLFDAAQNDRKPAVMVAFAGFDLYVRGENWPRCTFAAEIAPAVEAEFAQLGFDGSEVGTGVDECAQHHVAADAGETIEIGDARESHGR